MAKGQNTSDRFWSKVDMNPHHCWEWLCLPNKGGYGKFRYNGVMRLAHRVAYELWYGSFDESLIVRHKCDNPICVRPDHLEVGTLSDNTQDMVSRGRQWQQKKTACKWGHDTWTMTKRGRKCTTCAVARTKAWRQSKRARNGSEIRWNDDCS